MLDGEQESLAKDGSVAVQHLQMPLEGRRR
jgi:hypothetical protein